MGSDLKNPYLRDSEPEAIRMGRGMAWFLIVLFLGVLVVPPLVRSVVDSSGGEATVFERLVAKASGVGLVEHLRAVETHVEGAFFTEAPRRGIQNLFTGVLGEGNRKTVIGEDGWLYLRPSVEALTSTGPLAAAPVGAASDPVLKRWPGPREAIRKFADELGERGVELVLVPVPVKAMVRPEGLGVEGSGGVVSHMDAAAFYQELEGMGVSVLDLGGVLWKLRGGDGVFLKQDTHWTAGAMEVAAGRVADFLRSRGWWEDAGERHGFEVVEVEAQGVGDLVEHLELGDGGGGFENEKVTLRRVIDVETGERPDSDRMARVSVVGDSFVNVFDDPGLGFGDVAGGRLGAGFGQHLARILEEPVHLSAINGQGATGARGAFARLYDDEVRAKKVVVWVIASRDLMYTPALAMGNSVEWGDVEWNPEVRPDGGETGSAGGEVIEALLVEKARLTDPKQVNYKQSLFETAWDVLRVEGVGEEKEGVRVFFWGFREKVPTAASGMRVGERYRFRIFPESARPGVESERRDRLLEEDFSESYFGELVGEEGAR